MEAPSCVPPAPSCRPPWGKETLHQTSLSSALTGVATWGGGGSRALCSLRASRLCRDRFCAHGSSPPGRQPASGAVLPAPSAQDDRCLSWSQVPALSSGAARENRSSWAPASGLFLAREQDRASKGHTPRVWLLKSLCLSGGKGDPPLQAWSCLNTCQPPQQCALHLHWDGG